MTQIDLSELGFREVYELINLLKAYMNEQNSGNKKQIWLNKIIYDNTIPKMVLLSDDLTQFEEYNGRLRKLPRLEKLSYMEIDN